MKKIFLYGPSGSGKTTVGRELAGKLGLAFTDLDEVIEQQSGKSIPEIMSTEGELTFRDMETRVLMEVCSDSCGVVSLGGGTLLRDQNRSAAELFGVVVCLEAGLATLVERLQADEIQRPLLQGDLEEKLSGLLGKRLGHYQSFAVRSNTEGLTPSQVAWQVQVELGRFRVHGMGQEYNVFVQPGSLDGLGVSLREQHINGPVAVVTEDHVSPLYAQRVGNSLKAANYETAVITVPEGEGSKTIRTVMQIWRGSLEAGLDRKSTIVALGGGVTGDLAGFAAATYLRGIRWVGVPTSLLSMVDASLGGKTGFDLPEGKNLVGAFHPPSLVLADPQVLATLPEAELRSGLAEVVKHGVVGDPALFELCASGFEALIADPVSVVRRAMAVKIAVIEADPYEDGVRASLNFGHTLGHAVESVSQYRLRHGEAVSIGMVGEARLAERLSLAKPGLSGRIAEVLSGLGLPVEIPANLAREALVHCMKVDKKKASGVVRFALPVEIGKVEVGVAVEELSQLFEN